MLLAYFNGCLAAVFISYPLTRHSPAALACRRLETSLSSFPPRGSLLPLLYRGTFCRHLGSCSLISFCGRIPLHRADPRLAARATP